MDVTALLAAVKNGDRRALARCISLVENETPEAAAILQQLQFTKNVPIVGITGPPGAGKSTLISALINYLTADGKTVGVIAVDPTSPFNFGSLLGDRLRMSEHFTNERVFIRSLATRGALGGLSSKAIEISDVMRYAGFDLIIIETVGVGQSEVEIAGLADTTVLVLVPESGDDVQALKSGVMEIADIFVVNKSDRPGASTFVKNISELLHNRKFTGWSPPVIKTVAARNEGADALVAAISQHHELNLQHSRRTWLLTEKAWRLLQRERMRGFDKPTLYTHIETALENPDFNLYRFVMAEIQKF